MFLLLARLWQMLRAKLPFCGGAHFLAGAPSLPPPLSPEQEKALLARMSAGDAAARDELITHNLRLVPCALITGHCLLPAVPGRCLRAGRKSVSGFLAAFCWPDAPPQHWTVLLGSELSRELGHS